MDRSHETKTKEQLIAELQALRSQIAHLQRPQDSSTETLAELAPVGIFRTDAAGHCTYVNDRWSEITGLDLDAALGDGWSKALHPDDREGVFLEWQQSVQENRTFQAEYRYQRLDGSTTWVFGQAIAEKAKDGTITGYVGTITGITTRKQVEDALHQQVDWQRLVMEMTQRIRQTLNLDEILNTAVAEVRQFLHNDRVIIFRFDQNWHGTVAVESVGDSNFSILDMQIYDPCFGESYVQPFQQGLITAKEDIYTAGITACHLELLTKLKVRANLVVPILQAENLWGLLIAHHCTAPRHWQPLEIDLLKQLATQLSIAIQQSTLYQQGQTELMERRRTEEALRRLKEELEIRVQERTQELERSQANLQVQVAREQLIGTITQRIRHSLDLDEMLATAVEEVRQILQADRALIFQLPSDHSGVVVQESVLPDYPTTAAMHFPDECFPVECYEYYCQGQPRIVLDVTTDEWANCLADFMQEVQVKTKMVAPIVRHQEDATPTVWGLLIVHACAHHRQWQTAEAQLLQQIANQLAIALQQAELYRHLQQELQERQRAEEALRRSEAGFRSLSESSPIGIFRANIQGESIYTNPRCQEICGFTAAEALGAGWRQFVHPEDLDRLLSTWAEAAQIKQEFAIELRHIHRDRSIRFCDVRVAPVLTASQDLIGYVGTIKDITERRAVEKMKDEFISIVSHELRTPLTSIRGSLGLLATGVFDNEPEQMQYMIHIAATDTERLVRLVNDILDLERLGSNKVALARQAYDAGELMQRSVEVMRSSAQESGITLAVTPLSIQIWADPDRIIQTLTNLLSNAIKFSSPNSTVWLTAQPAPETGKLETRDLETGEEVFKSHILFAVRDQGRGIPADMIENIFGRFQQVDASDARLKGGTGLGLAICQTIVHQHGGQIWVESVLGEGSTFFLTVPIVPT